MSGIVKVKSGSESDLMGAVANVGPVAVAVDGSSNAFRVSRGSMTSPACTLHIPSIAAIVLFNVARSM